MKALQPDYKLALQYYRKGRSDKAHQVCVQILRTMPDHVPTLSLIGKMELKAGRLEPAIRSLEHAVRLSPNSSIDLCNLGAAYHRQGLLDKAADALARAVRIDPTRVDAVFNLGLVLLSLGDSERGLAFLTRAADLKPDAATIQRSLAKELLQAGRFSDAVVRFRQALALSPASVELSNELLAALEKGGRFAEAEELAEQVVKSNINLVEGHLALGRALSKQHKLSEAAAAFQRAFVLNPNAVSAVNSLAATLAKLGRVDEALEHLERAVSTNATLASEHSNLVFHAAFSSHYDAERLQQVARRWSDLQVAPLLAKRQPHRHVWDPNRRLRLGYVSPDFRGHVQRLFTLPILRNHDHSVYEVVCYSSVTVPDRFTEEIKSQTDEWHDVSRLSDSGLAQKIREESIDVLVDLTMHMSGCRLKVFAEKPAPVQITWLAYPGTTGVEGMDYRITDPYLDPPGAPLPYSEQSLWLPHTFWCFSPESDEGIVNDLPLLSSGFPTFGCLNNFMKVNRAVLELWARVLNAIPRSKLLLLAPRGWSQNFVTEVLEEHGVSPERMEFVEVQGRQQYLATYNRIDVALDTFPYNGHTTSLDAFFMGVPVVTLVGQTIVGRAGLCMASNLNLADELVARDADQFVDLAVRLCSDPTRLNALRQGLRSRMEKSPLMEAQQFTRDLEAAYRDAWQRWCAEPI